jgi:hypothetical protein
MGNVRRALAVLCLAAGPLAPGAFAYDPTPPPMGREPWDPPLAEDAPPPPTTEEREVGHANPFKACRSRDAAESVLDQASHRVHETVCGATLWFDGLFGERDLASARGAHGRVEVSTEHSEFEGEEVRVRFDARIQLPAFERRLSAFVGRDNEDDVAQDRAEGLGLRSQADALNRAEDWFAGLGYRLKDLWGVRSEFRVGVRDLSEPTAFAQLRNSWTAYQDDDDRIQLRLTPFWNTRDHAGVTAATSFDHALTVSRLLRWGSIATVAEETTGMQWRSALVLYQNLRRRRALAFEIFERGATAAPVPVVEYGARTIYRQPFFEGRLFAELVLGYSWPRVDPALEREGSGGVTAGVELPFGARSASAPAPEQGP